MFNKKKIKQFEARVAVLERQSKALSDSVAVLDFKEKSNGTKYIIETVRRYLGFDVFENNHKISYLSFIGDKVITKEFYKCAESVKQNDKYLEFWHNNEISRAMCVEDDKLVSVDIDVYKKAFANRIKAIQHIVKVKASAKQATDAIEQVTAVTEQFKNTLG